MPPSTFASAAAGNNYNQSSAREAAPEWGRRPNGATQTFRRQSNTTTPSSVNIAADPLPPTQALPARYVPPHRNGTTTDTRYSKTQLLDLYRTQLNSDGSLREALSHLYVNGWQPEATNGSTSAGWGRSEHVREIQAGPEVCWDRDGAVEPLGLTDLDDEERELFTSSVNTPLKPPTQNKENQQSNGLQRKISVSHTAASPGGFALPSPSTTRSALRRRETSESYPFPASLTSPTTARDERGTSPPPSLMRRKTDLKTEDKAEDDKSGLQGFGSLRRNPTVPLSAGLNTPSSPWSSTPLSGGFPPMGSFQQSAQDKRAALGSGRAESRFKGLLQKDSTEDMGGRVIDRKGSIASLHKVDEAEAWKSHDLANATLDEADEDPLPSGSAALGASSDISPSRLRSSMRGFDTPSRSNTRDEHGFGAFGMTADHTGFGMNQTPAHRGGNNEPMSPTDTNPYQSPEQHNIHQMHEEHEEAADHHTRLPGLGGFGTDQHHGLGGLAGFPNISALSGSTQGPASDRSQTSSVGPARGFGLGGLGGLPGSSAWPPSAGGLGGNRQAMGLPSPFGQGIFSANNDSQSSNLAGLGGNTLAGGHHGAFSSRMASMFPQGMQEQMQLGENGHEYDDNQQAFGTISHNQPFDASDSDEAHPEHSSSQPPPPQQRTMVMPDRMRWIYKDPQGQTQGPWSGLEMHDWYRAGFFSPELLVKKAEDADYEPLAQLIRRIGNSREPFLVPQIGIPHGAPSTQAPWAGAIPGPPAGTQPPFAGSFPSFGTTLTAEQQNALERRKQEEQYLMARQKEHLAQAQIAQRMGMQGHAFGAGHMQNLNHHSSAQSLHSQPSMSSVTSPSAYQPSPTQAPTGHGIYDNTVRGPAPAGLGAVGAETLGHIREEEIPSIMDRLNIGNGRAQPANVFGAPGQPFAAAAAAAAHTRNVQQMLQDRTSLQQEQSQHDSKMLPMFEHDRLREFQQLQSQMLENQYQQIADEQEEQAHEAPQEPLSLTEQVQKAASAKQSPAVAQQVWAKIEAGLPGAFPPPPSQSPLPAPAAQRTGRQSVADQLAQESSRSQTPSADTPSAAVAPWAKEPSEVARGPSLKEIQEMEAKKAAELEELAVASRRAALQKEMEAQALAAATIATVAPGLPATASWATNGASPATPIGTGSPWSKAAQQKPTLAQAKSMTQIQKEEEARKKKLVAAQAQANANAMATVVTPAGGKSYANLASKTGAPSPALGGAWTTVGASGKAKTPGTPAVPVLRAVSSGIVPTVTSTGARKPATRSATMVLPGVVNAQEEFRKWAVAELRPDLNKGISAEDFVQALISFGPDHDIITEAVHGSSNTIDSRHFAEEFLRRKKLADKGQIDTTLPPKSASPNAANSTAGGWSEVAKKGPTKEVAKEESNGNFRVVTSKKKTGKR